jgi:hypothetical protein
MTTNLPDPPRPAFPLGLLLADGAATFVVALCLAEHFAAPGGGLGLIPGEYVWPLLLAAITVAGYTTYLVVRALLRSRHGQVR